MSKSNHLKIILVVPILIFLTACGTSNSDVATFREQKICEETTNVKDFIIKSTEYTHPLAIYNIKALGTKWTESTNPNLRDVLKEVSEYEIAPNVKENFDNQPRYYLTVGIAIDLFYKFAAIDNACTNFTNIVNEGIDNKKLYEIYISRFGNPGGFGI